MLLNCLSLLSWFLPSLVGISSLADHVNGLIGLTDSFRTTAAGSSVLTQRLSYEFDSVLLSFFMFLLVGSILSRIRCHAKAATWKTGRI